MRVVHAMGDRLHFFSDIADDAAYFFVEEYPYEEKAVRKRLLKEGALDKLAAMREHFADVESWTGEEIEKSLRALAEKMDVGAGQFIHPVRVAVSGTSQGPSLFEMLEVLGKERVLARIDRTLERVQSSKG
jgi:glutamyl/glutaminyl-tRNA synthetase